MFEIVHGEGVTVYLHMYSGNVQQNPLCVESFCITKAFSIFPRFSPTIISRCKFSTPTNASFNMTKEGAFTMISRVVVVHHLGGLLCAVGPMVSLF